MTRKTLAMTAVVASLGLLSACSKSDDAQTPPPAPAPSTTPAPAAPAAPVAPAPQEQSAPADQQSMGDKMKDTASAAGDAIADKAGELAEKAGTAANHARESVKEGAAKADAAIQSSIGNEKK